jgi:hypothetical protein
MQGEGAPATAAVDFKAWMMARGFLGSIHATARIEGAARRRRSVRPRG